MARFPFRASAIGACLFMVAALALLQFALTPERAAPWGLFWLFIGLWVFGAAMLARAPRFGALGTTAWGVLSALGAWRTHATLDLENVVLVLGSLVAAGLALGTLLARDW